tara:strand:- start:4230 stop:4562 length:333 start_codon:yes stop_codon:yes gene_type:complete
MNKKETYDWQKFINDCDKDETGRIIMSEEVKAEHFLKMREVNKNTNWEEIKARFKDKPTDKDGYYIITEEDRARANKIVAWIDEHYPNCNYIPFVEQDKIGDMARKTLNI